MAQVTVDRLFADRRLFRAPALRVLFVHGDLRRPRLRLLRIENTGRALEVIGPQGGLIYPFREIGINPPTRFGHGTGGLIGRIGKHLQDGAQPLLRIAVGAQTKAVFSVRHAPVNLQRQKKLFYLAVDPLFQAFLIPRLDHGRKVVYLFCQSAPKRLYATAEREKVPFFLAGITHPRQRNFAVMSR